MGTMPTISQFFGISIRIYYEDHGQPHFHAYYAEFEAVFAIYTLEILRGGIPRRVTALVLEWAVSRRQELRKNWERARAHEPLRPISPLE
jgi:hypothetical protein